MMKKRKGGFMKKILLMVFCALLYSGIALAHPPSAIQVKAIDTTQIEVTIVHGTRDADAHHIEEIVVFLNGKKIIAQDFSTQQNNEAQKAVYNLPELIKNPKAVIKVYADCNKGGDKTKEFVLGK
jgi:desulfoferrodoxin (superoxide reductase-like protein)